MVAEISGTEYTQCLARLVDAVHTDTSLEDYKSRTLQRA